MPDTTKQDVAKVGIRLLDDAYIGWVAAEIECEQALRAWAEAMPGQRAGAYYTYRAALEREEAAANDLQRLSSLTEPCAHALLAG